MDPNAIFLFLFLLVFLVLTIVNLFYLLIKIFNSPLKTVKKIFLAVLLPAILIFIVMLFIKDTSNNLVYGWTSVFVAAAISGINWGINLSKKFNENKRQLAAVIISIGFTILLPAALSGLVILFDNLDLIQE